MTVRELLRNVLGRIALVREALMDGDVDFASELVADLEHDIAGGLAEPEELRVA